jgi:L-histidine N-alpha-methyltransferase
VDVRLTPADLRVALQRDAKAGLLRRPRELPPKWLYDCIGSALYDAITHQPEYYPAEREREILKAHAGEVAALTGAQWLVELGSGTSEKTRFLLDALVDERSLRIVTPFDVSEGVLRSSAAQLARAYPGLFVYALVGDFERHLGALPRAGRRLFVFLGGTLGNLKPMDRARFLCALRGQLGPKDALLLGTDLLKELPRLNAAYNDEAGVTAAFNLNVLNVLNRELGADFRLELFEHVARFDPGNGWVEMLLRSRREQRVTLRALQSCQTFEEGELLRTEVSAKFHPDAVCQELERAGLSPVRTWTDGAGDFLVTLAVPA